MHLVRVLSASVTLVKVLQEIDPDQKSLEHIWLDHCAKVTLDYSSNESE